MTRCTLIVAYVADTQPRRNGVRFYVPSHINTHFFKFAYLSRKHGSSICVEKKNQLDVTECFIALMICSTCFGHLYAQHQELETICVLLPPMVCSAWLLVVGVQVQGSRLCVQEEGCCTTASCNIPFPGRTPCCPAPDPQQLATKHCTP